MLIGSHVAFKGKEMLVGSVNEAASYGANVFMIYTGAPQNTRRKPLADCRIDEGRELMQKVGIETLTVHAPYIINLANTVKPGVADFGVEFLKEELNRAHALGAQQVTLHPGAHVGAGADKGIKQLIKGLNQVLIESKGPKIALETMAGKGTELGRTFDELAQIIDGVHYNDRLSITFDTCHVFDAGYDIVQDADGVLVEFDRIIGLDRIGVIHINDSKNNCGSHKDRHANVGMGQIGFDPLNHLVHLREFSSIPKILETPWVSIDDTKKIKKAPYKYEIEMFKNGVFNPNWMENLEQ